MTSIDPRIFRAYDIRGRAADQLTPDAARAIALAYGLEVARRSGRHDPTMAVGRDARTHGPALEAAVVEGLTAAGCRISTIGPTPSPISFFTICDRHLDGGIQVTASHNPPQDNGLKLSLRDAEAFAGDDIQRLREATETEPRGEGGGSVAAIDAVSTYVAHVAKIFGDSAAGLKVVVDAGNGIAGPANCQVLARCGAALTELYTDPDGTFPNHPADPSKHDTLKDLQATVREVGADIGIAFDGDGDRLGIVDENGKIRTADEILLLLARDHLSRRPGAPVVFTVSNSGVLQTEIAAWGGRPVLCKVGHSFVEHAMRENNALLGGEQSGHFFCGEDYFPYDDALVAALRVIAILQDGGKPLSALMADFPTVYQSPERRPHCPDDRKAAVIEAATAHFAKTHPVNTLDGARIDFGDDAWAGLRMSNTSPCLSICLEARSPEKLAEVEREVLGHLQGYPEIEWGK